MTARLAVAALLGAPLLAACAGGAAPLDPRSEACGSCHAEEHDAWSGSRHASSASSPVFQGLLPRIEASWGSVARARCVSCHAPGFGDEQGIGCVACHGAVGNRGAKDGALVIDPEAPMATGHASPPNGAHEVEVRELLTSSELCATCHEVHGPGLLEEATFTELAGSTVPGRTCAGCHMKARPEGGVDHRFIGVDPPWGAGEAARASAAEASRELIARALTLEVRDAGASLEVVLTNAGGGHAVPTGVAFVRDFWVDARMLDAQGKVHEAPRIIELGARTLREGIEVATPADADTIESRSLAPEASRRVPITLPDGGAPVSIEVTLRARAVRAALLDALEIGNLAAEVPELAVATAHWP